tara:strand:+ start:5833 stop:7110 length:1278 start_codon:yes stop_codon:yes gene_type:complete
LSKKPTVAIIGLGYVGLPFLRLLCLKKFNVFGFDIDEDKIRLLKKNESYISDIKNNQLRVVEKDKLFSMKKIEKIKESDFIILCLPTPLDKRKRPDMSKIIKAFNTMKPFLKKKQTIILESTVYPGATRNIFSPFISKKFKIGKNFFIGYSSERISPGQTDVKHYKFSFENTTKVISGYDTNSLKKIRGLYRLIFKSLFSADTLEVAEMSKLVENSYRSVNIGLVNELKVICKKMRININKVIETAGTKPFGYNRFYPGPGVGGHCIPIDPIFLKWSAQNFGVNAKFISLARSTNLKITDWVLREICNNEPRTKNLKYKKKILLIGLAYKADVNDLRESPSVKIFKYLLKYKNLVHYHDNKINNFKINKKTYNSVNLSNINRYDYVIIGTNHSDLNKNFILKNSKKIFDTRGLFSKISSRKVVSI